MRKRRNVILGLAITSWLAIACGSGVGALSTLDDGIDRPTDTREKPVGGREVPVTTGHDVPPRIGDNPGTQGGGPGTGGGTAETTCPPCDGKLECLNGTKKTTINLKTVNGQCSAGDGVTFDCGGQVLQGGQPIGTWVAAGSSYTVTVSAEGQSQTLICTKSAATPAPTGTGTGTGTAPTSTTPPTDASVPPPQDAGIKG